VRFFSSLILFLLVCANVMSYDFGYGYEVNDKITAGGYISTKYKNTSEKEELELDDIAFLIYGDLNDRFSFLFELESAGTYIHYLNNGHAEKNIDFQVERAYLQYSHNEYVSLRVGKFLAQVGLWNLIPIVVFRETSQKPRITTEIFPRFTTGANLSIKANNLKWDLFVQHNDDIDKDYNNFYVKEHYGVKGSYKIDQNTFGGNIGWFRDDFLGMDSYYYGIHAKRNTNKYKLHSEGYIASLNYDSSKSINMYTNRNFEKKGIFVQATYEYSHPLHFTYRYEMYNDEMENLEFYNRMDKLESINLLGLNYRPMYNMSLKVEYQTSSLEKNDDIGVVSFSVLF